MKILVRKNNIDGYKFLIYLMDDNDNRLEAFLAHNAIDLAMEINKLRLKYHPSFISSE